jgi:hypothetical protein
MDLKAREPHDPKVMVLKHLTYVPTFLSGKIGHSNSRKESKDSFRNQCKTYELVQGGVFDKVNSYPSHVCRFSYMTWNVQSGFGYEQEMSPADTS